MPIRLDVRNSRELQAVLLAVRGADKAIQTEIRQRTKAIGLPEWKAELEKNGYASPLTKRVLIDTARLAPSNQNIRLSSATVGRSLSGGLNPKTAWPAVEFGANREKRTTYTATSRTGRRFTVHNRRTARQMPPRRASGWTFYPAVAAIVPRLAALWTQTVVRTFAERLEGKGGS